MIKYLNEIDRCRCGKCIVGIFYGNERITNNNCTFLIKGEDEYRCVLTDPRTEEEKQITEEYKKFLESKGYPKSDIDIMRGGKGIFKEFEKYLEKKRVRQKKY